MIKGLEDKIKELETSLKEKDIMLQTAESSLAESRSQNTKLGEELNEAQTILDESSRRFDQETKELKIWVEAKAENVAEPPELFQLKCLSSTLKARPHLNGNNTSVPRI
jgi:septal ring factor EnvC (AmiA/AmiB activator)